MRLTLLEPSMDNFLSKNIREKSKNGGQEDRWTIILLPPKCRIIWSNKGLIAIGRCKVWSTKMWHSIVTMRRWNSVWGYTLSCHSCYECLLLWRGLYKLILLHLSKRIINEKWKNMILKVLFFWWDNIE